MATWAKTKGFKDSWINQNRTRLLNIYDIEEKWGDSYYATLYKNKYAVDITSTSWPLNTIERKSFKTKSQAIRYAKAYMRKN